MTHMLKTLLVFALLHVFCSNALCQIPNKEELDTLAVEPTLKKLYNNQQVNLSIESHQNWTSYKNPMTGENKTYYYFDYVLSVYYNDVVRSSDTFNHHPGEATVVQQSGTTLGAPRSAVIDMDAVYDALLSPCSEEELQEVALKTTITRLGLEALNRISNSHSLDTIAENAKDDDVRKAAIELERQALSSPLETGTFQDSRDGKVYRTVKIGTQWIMAANLAYKPKKGRYWAYNNDMNNVAKYGYLYDWDSARTVAPPGWHLPSEEEWTALFKYLGGNSKKVFNAIKEGNRSGFDVLFGGRLRDREFGGIDEVAGFWSSTKAVRVRGAMTFGCYRKGSTANMSSEHSDSGLSVRLLRDK